MSKKILAIVLALVLLVTLTACGGDSGKGGGSDHVDGSVEELLGKVTEGATDPEMVLMTSQANADNFNWYFFIDPIDGAEAWVSEPMMNAIAHFVGLIRVPAGTDAAAVQADIEANLDPMKWICVEPEQSEVLRRDDLILVVMSTKSTVSTVVDNFNNL